MASLVALIALLGHFAWLVHSVPPLDPVRPQIELSLRPDGPAPLPVSAEWVVPRNPDAATCIAVPDGSDGRRVVAYLAAGDAAGAARLAQDCGRIDLVLAETYTLIDRDGSIRLESASDNPAPNHPTLPVLGIDPRLTTAEAEALLADPAQVGALSVRLGLLGQDAAAGLCLDLGSRGTVPAATVATALDVLAGDGQRCLIGPPEAGFWEDAELVDTLDLAVVLGFERPEGPAASPAPEAWFDDAVTRAKALVPGDRLVMALGTTGYTWQSGALGLHEVSYAQGMSAAAAHDAAVAFVPWAGAARYRAVDLQGGLNEAWLPDAAGFQNQLATLGPRTAVAVWPLGAEDPGLWGLLDAGRTPAEVLAAPIDLGGALQVQGDGAFLAAAKPARAGMRTVVMDADGQRVLEAGYAVVPKVASIVRVARPDDSSVSLVFEGLPAAAEWPEVAAVLENLDITAAFVADSRALIGHGGVAAGIVRAGHVLATRAMSDGVAADVGPGTLMAGNLRELLVAERAGVRTRFVELAEGDGFAVQADRLITAGFVPFAPASALRPDALHDSGAIIAALARDGGAVAGVITVAADHGDWPAVVAALPGLLSDLAAQGYGIGPFGHETGLVPAEAMPLAGPLPLTATLVFEAARFFAGGFNTLFFWFLIYSGVRALIYLGLALARRPRRSFDAGWTPPVAVIVPAYNEEKVIESCIASILSSPYPELSVVVVDDGSSDRTCEVARAAYGDDPRVTILRQRNGGKWAAANAALMAVDAPYFVIADADSVFLPDTIGWLVQQFKDPRVGAVAGLVEVGNRAGALGRFQSLEYIVSQSLIRRAQELFNGILVVPGAVGAWRTEAVRKAGLFSGQTVTEDADLTVAVHRAGYLVRFQEQARSITEAPSSVRGFMRQRVRWTFGMLQTSWKHRRAIAEGRSVGIVSIVDAIWFGVASSLFAPLVDLLLIVLLVQGAVALATGGLAAVGAVPLAILVAYFALTLLDVLNTVVAFRFERRFDWGLLAMVPLMRFGYRQLLYVATIRALWQAIEGTAAAWNKLDRTGAILTLWNDRPERRPNLAGAMLPAAE